MGSPLCARVDRAIVRRLAFSPAPAFLLASLFLFVIHEPWRDEAQPWLVARDAPNMFAELDSETHPALWYLIAFPLAKLGLPYVSLRIVHLAIVFAALCVFLLEAPFSRLEKWLYPFGYFVLYEYGTLTRNYAILLLVLYLIAATWRTRFEKPLLHGALLLLLTQTLAHGVLLAGVLSAAYGIEWIFRERKAAGYLPLAALALAALGALLAYLQIAPKPDVALWRTSWNTDTSATMVGWTSHALIHAFAPVPRLTDWTWGSTWLENVVEGSWLVTLAALLWIGASLAFAKRPRALGMWLAGSAILVVIYHVKSGVSAQTRHHGLLFVWWIFCLWIGRLERAPDASRPQFARAGSAVLCAMLLLHVANFGPAVAQDVAREFSGGPGGAAYLREHGYTDERTLIGVYPSFIAAPVLAHLPPMKMWLFQVGEYGSYTRFTHEDAANFGGDFERMLREFDAEVARVDPENALVITSFFIGPRDDLVLLDSHDSISPGDAIYIYERVPGQAPVNPITP